MSEEAYIKLITEITDANITSQWLKKIKTWKMGENTTTPGHPQKESKCQTPHFYGLKDALLILEHQKFAL